MIIEPSFVGARFTPDQYQCKYRYSSIRGTIQEETDAYIFDIVSHVYD